MALCWWRLQSPGAPVADASLSLPNPQQVPDIVDAALREADADHDGAVNMADFRSFLDSRTDDSLALFDPRLSRDGASSGSDDSGCEAGGPQGGGEEGGSRSRREG